MPSVCMNVRVLVGCVCPRARRLAGAGWGEEHHRAVCFLEVWGLVERGSERGLLDASLGLTGAKGR